MVAHDHKKIQNSNLLKKRNNKNTVLTENKTLNDVCFTKVNWKQGFEEASSKQLFDCIFLSTSKVSEIVKKRKKEIIQRYVLKQKRDNKLAEMICDETTTEEAYTKGKSIAITNMVGSILKSAGNLGNPLQSMVARNIRFFEGVRKQNLVKVEAKQTPEMQEKEEEEKLIIEDAKNYLNQVNKFKAIYNPILAFGFTEGSKNLF